MSKKKVVKIAVQSAAFASLDEFVWFQGELKSLPPENYEKLKKSISKLGFSFSLSVWINPEEKLILIDGHQRVLTLKSMRNEGWEIPFLPYEVVDANSYEEAKKKVLAGASQYGEVQHLGVAQFLQDVEIGAYEANETFHLPSIDFANLPQLKEIDVSGHKRNIVDDPEKEWDGMPEFDQENQMSYKKLILLFEKQEDVEKFFQLINQTFTDKTKSVWFPKKEKVILRKSYE